MDIKIDLSDIEDDRQDLLGEYSELKYEDFKSGTFGFHELIDRSSLVLSHFDENILNHPACFHNEELFIEAYIICQYLGRFYQKVATSEI